MTAMALAPEQALNSARTGCADLASPRQIR